MNTENINIDFLITRLKQGNEHAFTSLYDMFAKQLYRNILRLVKDEDTAEELLQDLFLKIWDNRERISVDGSFKSFLYKVAENLVYGHFRKVAKNKRLIDKLILSSIDYVSNVEDAIITKETHALLKKAVESLPPKRKQVYTLCKIEGKTYDEVSKELKISSATVRNHIVEANKSVKKYFLSNQDMAVLLVVTHIFLSKN